MTQLTPEIVSECYRALLGRNPESEQRIAGYVNSGTSLGDLVRTISGSAEFRRRQQSDQVYNAPPSEFGDCFGANFLAPTPLSRGAATPRGKFLLIGACFVETWADIINTHQKGRRADFHHIDTIRDGASDIDWPSYDYAIVQVPLRHIFPDHMYLKLIRDSLVDDTLFEKCVAAVKYSLSKWVERIHPASSETPVIYMGFLEPMFRIDGCIAGAQNPGEPYRLIRELNDYLCSMTAKLINCAFLDADRISASIGRRYIQEESFAIYSHGGLMNDFDYNRDHARIEPPQPATRLYQSQPDLFVASVLREAEAIYRTKTAVDRVKLLFVDLDDTLWRGVLAEEEFIDVGEATEGWPRGMIEALTMVKRRGVILCLLSKNDPIVIERIWTDIYGRDFPLSEFALLKINWNDKASNIEEALREANILPHQAMLLDDNPVERHLATAAFPDLRVVSAPHYAWKRILMLSPELQTEFITDESIQRTATIRAKLERDAFMAIERDGDALRDLRVSCQFTIIGPETARFKRVHELINKTNQFNTTGMRIIETDLAWYCSHGLVLAMEVRDRFSSYGLVGACLYADGVVHLVVLSCRVFKMDVEIALIARLMQLTWGSGRTITGRIVKTTRNGPCLDLFERCGWRSVGDDWIADTLTAMPPHIAVLGQEEPAVKAGADVSQHSFA